MAGAADAVAPPPARGSTGEHSPPGFAGWFDLELISAVDPTCQHDPRIGVRCRRPGLDVDAGADCTFAVDGRRLAIVRGAPRVEEERVQRLLKERGAAFALLELAARDGERAIAQLRGRFSVCLIELEPRRVLLATDRFAVLPVCWSVDGSRIAFADRVDKVPLRQAAPLSSQAIYDYLYSHMIPAPHTVRTRINRLRVAERLLATQDHIDVAPYWKPTFARSRKVSERDLAERFRTVLRAAVARESGACRTGAYLSGGTDSSTLAGLLRAVSDGPVTAYSIGFDADGYDEMHYARLVARHFGLEHRAHYLTAAELVSAIPAIGAYLEQPFGNSSIVPAYWCAQLAAADGVTRLLAGDGGDELFGGNTRYAKQKVFDVYGRLPAALRAQLQSWSANGRGTRLPLLRKLRSYVAQASVPLPARAESYNLLKRLGTDGLLTADFLHAVDEDAPARQQALTWARVDDDVALVDRMLAYDWQYTLADSDLPKVCASAALAGVSVGFPMLDDDLLELSLELPASMKVRGLTLRHFFKRALRGFLPAEVIRKRKHGFGMPFGIWLLRDAALGRFVDDRLATLSERGIFLPGVLQRLRAERLPEHPGYYGEMIWIALMLEEWLRAHAPDFEL